MTKVINSRFKECRTELSLSPGYVSNLVGVSTSVLNAIEKGTLQPNAGQIKKLAEVYGCPEKYFYSFEEETHIPVLARNGGQLSDFDTQQIVEFLAFQREASKFINTNKSET